MDPEIDESLYSRQLYVFGKKAMQALSKKKILITGINGLGLEVAKNVILSGVDRVTLHDPEDLTAMDLSSYFFASRDDIGTNRAAVGQQKLCELNEYVKVDRLEAPLSQAVIAEYDVVVLCDSKSNNQISQINEWCRNAERRFISANARGIFGVIFCDFGTDFVVTDVSGTEPESFEVASIEKSKEGLVYIGGDKGHGYCDESLVVFSGLKGMTELNNLPPKLVSINDYRSFYIGDTTNYNDYVPGSGFVKEVFLHKPIEFKPFFHFCEEFPKSEEILISDYSKLYKPKILHLCHMALNMYCDKYNEMPRSWNSSDADKFLEIIKDLSLKFSYDLTDKDEEIIKIFSYVARGNLNPLHASLGGIVAQEVIKAASQQFTPITQWYFNDYMECLSDDCLTTVDTEIYNNTESRYDGQIAVFGSKFQEILENLKYFVVGAGAIGCELLKNFSMIGIGSGKSGKIVVTDMDFIERSNLNRQFLFRNWDIGHSKSQTASKAVLKMNPGLNIEAQENRLGVETENFYNNAFFQSLDCVVNALDNVEARRYAAGRIEFNNCPMVDSGTMGPQASQQVIIPHLTQSYKTEVAKENAIPICTLKNFPYEIEHTIQWAKDLFITCFTNNPKLADVFSKDKTEFFNTINKLTPPQRLDTLNQICNFLKSVPKSFNDCIEWALNEWFHYFSKNIQQILHSFPPDAKTTEGLPFWSGTKRVPRFENFDVNESNIMDFIIAASKLRARIFNVSLGTDEDIRSFASSYKFENFTPSSEVKIATEDSEIDKLLDTKQLNCRMEELRNLDFKEQLNLNPQEFEKDNDSNFHIDFITAASNMRAFNYNIEPVDRFKTKKIAGNIIPAIATSTSVISGQVCFELFKLAQRHRNIRQYRDSYLNLASPVFTMTIPEAAKKYKVLDKSYTLWDKFDVKGDITLKEFLDLMKKEHNMDVTCVTYKKGVLFAEWLDKDYRDDIINRLISDIIKNKINQVICESETIIPIYISIEDENGEDIDGVPIVRYHLL